MNLIVKPSKENIKTYVPIGLSLVFLSFLDVFVNAWTRKAGASEKAPAMSFSFSPVKQHAETKEVQPVDMLEDSDIPF